MCCIGPVKNTALCTLPTSAFQRLQKKVTEATLLECSGVKVPEGKCGWRVNSLHPSRKIKNLTVFRVTVTEAEGNEA